MRRTVFVLLPSPIFTELDKNTCIKWLHESHRSQIRFIQNSTRRLSVTPKRCLSGTSPTDRIPPFSNFSGRHDVVIGLTLSYGQSPSFHIDNTSQNWLSYFWASYLWLMSSLISKGLEHASKWVHEYTENLCGTALARSVLLYLVRTRSSATAERQRVSYTRLHWMHYVHYFLGTTS